MAARTPAAPIARALSLALLAIAGLASCAQPLTPPPPVPPGATPSPPPTPTPPPIATFAGVSDPRGLVFDGSGHMWLTNGASGSSTPAGRVVKLTTEGVAADMVDLGVELGACAVAGDYLWTVSASPSATLWRIGLSDLATESFDLATGSRPVQPQGLMADAQGRLWLADAGNDLVSIFQNGVRLRDLAIPRATESLGPAGIVMASESVWVAAKGDERLYQFRLSDYAQQDSLTLPKPATGILGVDKNDQVWAGHAFYQGTNAVAKFLNAATEPRYYDVGQEEPAALVGDQRGYVWTALRTRNTVSRVTPATGIVVFYMSDAIVRPRAIAVDAQGNAWVAGQESLARVPAAP